MRPEPVSKQPNVTSRQLAAIINATIKQQDEFAKLTGALNALLPRLDEMTTTVEATQRGFATQQKQVDFLITQHGKLLGILEQRHVEIIDTMNWMKKRIGQVDESIGRGGDATSKEFHEAFTELRRELVLSRDRMTELEGDVVNLRRAAESVPHSLAKVEGSLKTAVEAAAHLQIGYQGESEARICDKITEQVQKLSSWQREVNEALGSVERVTALVAELEKQWGLMKGVLPKEPKQFSNEHRQ